MDEKRIVMISDWQCTGQVDSDLSADIGFQKHKKGKKHGKENIEAKEDCKMGEEHEECSGESRRNSEGDDESPAGEGRERDQKAGEGETWEDSGRWSRCSKRISETTGWKILCSGGVLQAGFNQEHEKADGFGFEQSREGSEMASFSFRSGYVACGRNCELQKDSVSSEGHQECQGLCKTCRGSEIQIHDGIWFGRESALIEKNYSDFGRSAVCLFPCETALFFSFWRRSA